MDISIPIVITGSSGFIGKNLIAGLKAQSYKKIIGIDKVIDQGLNERYKPHEFVNINFFDDEILRDVIPNGSLVVHLACTSNPRVSEIERDKDITDNVIGTLRLMDVCLEKNVKNFIFLSSGGTVYGRPEQTPIPETHCCRPICSHGVMKLMIENFLNVYHEINNFNYVIVRGSNPYGWGHNPNKKQGIINVFINKIISGEKLEVWGDGKVVRDYIYIDDFTDGLITVIKSDVNADILNLGSGKGYSILEILEALRSTVTKDLLVDFIESRKIDVPVNILDIKKISDKLGWTPKYNLEEGIAATYDKLK